MAGFILFQLGLGFYSVRLLTGQDSDTLVERFYIVQTHKSWGVLIFTLALIRVAWRLANPRPSLPADMGSLERALAEGTHIALYVLVVSMPLTGWLYVSASTLQDSYGIKNMVFGLFELPDPFVPGSKELETVLGNIHSFFAFSMATIVSLHILAAVKHQIIDRDGLLRRMVLG